MSERESYMIHKDVLSLKIFLYQVIMILTKRAC